MKEVKFVVSNGFREHKVAVATELLDLSDETLAASFNPLANALLGVEGESIVTAEDVGLARENGRNWFRANGWLCEIYFVE